MTTADGAVFLASFLFFILFFFCVRGIEAVRFSFTFDFKPEFLVVIEWCLLV